MLIGVHHLSGIIAANKLEEFSEAYFFSSQTLTTVGYGRVSPVGLLANITAAIESFLGVITFALITGLLYGRFTKPRAFIKFSQIAVIAPFENTTGFMLRLAPSKNSTISSLKASVTISLNVTENGITRNKFLVLPLQISNVMSLALSWTIVHPIDEDSPLYGLTKEDIEKSDVHIMVFIEGFDEGFSNTVVSRTEYLSNEICFGYKFEPMYRYSEKERRNQLDLRMINRIHKV
jgi:inward rectifier potassium channel